MAGCAIRHSVCIRFLFYAVWAASHIHKCKRGVKCEVNDWNCSTVRVWVQFDGTKDMSTTSGFCVVTSRYVPLFEGLTRGELEGEQRSQKEQLDRAPDTFPQFL